MEIEINEVKMNGDPEEIIKIIEYLNEDYYFIKEKPKLRVGIE